MKEENIYWAPTLKMYDFIESLLQAWLPVAQMVKCLPTMWETWVQSLGQEDFLEKEWQPTPVFLPGESHGRRSLVSYSAWGPKESNTTERLHFQYLYYKPLLPLLLSLLILVKSIHTVLSIDTGLSLLIVLLILLILYWLLMLLVSLVILYCLLMLLSSLLILY